MKIYKREAQGLENAIVKNYMSDEPRIKFIADLKLDIKNDHPLRAEMNSTNENRIKKAISVIKRLINLKQSEFQRIHFEPYDNKIADLIDAY